MKKKLIALLLAAALALPGTGLGAIAGAKNIAASEDSAISIEMADGTGAVSSTPDAASAAAVSVEPTDGLYAQAVTFDEARNATVDPTVYGADPSGKMDSAVAIWNAFEAAKRATSEGAVSVTVAFPKGEYHIYKDYVQQRVLHTSNTNSIDNPTKWNALLIEKQENFTLEGNDSMFIMHGDMMAVTVVESENVKLQNFSWDFAVPTVSEMTVKETGTVDGQYYTDYYISSKHPFRINGNSLVWESERSPYTGKTYWERTNTHGGWTNVYYDPATKIQKRTGSSPFGGTITKLDENTIRITSDGARPDIEKPGVVYAFCATPLRTSAGAFNYESKDILVQNVNVHYMHGFGWLTEMCENVTYSGCTFMPRDGTGHLTTGYADLIHVSGAKGTIKVENCDFSFPQDDHINIHGIFTIADQRISDTELKLIYKNDGLGGPGGQLGGYPQYHVGDQVMFSTRQGLQPLNDIVYTVVSVVNPYENGNNGKTMQVTFDKTLPSQLAAKDTYVAENITYTPKVEIKGNYFGTLPTRTILCTTRQKVVIENNVFVGSTMQPMFLSNDSYAWYESGPIRDLTIKGNTFYTKYAGVGDMNAVISIHPESGGLPGAESPIHHNITIEGNTFYTDSTGGSVQGIHAESVKNLVIKDNHFYRWNPDVTLTLTGGADLAPGGQTQLAVQAAGKTNTGNLFSFTNCNGVTIQGNTYDDGQNMNIATSGSLGVTNSDGDKGLGTGTGVTPAASGYVYLSSNPAVATVDKTGMVSGASAGTATITACYDWDGTIVRSNPLTVTVAGDPAPLVNGIQIGNTGNAILSAVDETRALTATVDPVSAAVSWSVVNAATGASTDCATVSASGLLAAKKSGLVTVKAEAGGLFAEQTYAIAIPALKMAENMAIAGPIKTVGGVTVANGENAATWSGAPDGMSVAITGEAGDLYGDYNAGGSGVKNMFLYTIPAEILAGDSVRAVVKISNMLSYSDGQYGSARFVLFRDNDNYTATGKAQHKTGFSTVNEALSKTNDILEAVGDSAQNNTSEAWFSIHKSGDAVTTAYKIGDGAWTTLHTVTNEGIGTNYKIGFAAWQGSGNKPTFSDFHLGAGTLTNEELLATQAIPFLTAAMGPTAANAALNAAAYTAGDTATVTYTYQPGDAAESGTIFEWTATDSGGSVRKTRTTTSSYVIPAAGTLTCTVYPVDTAGVPGTPVTTALATVTDSSSTSLKLSALEVLGGAMSAFHPDTLAYTVKLPFTVEQISLRYSSERAIGTTSIAVNGTPIASAPANSGSATLAVTDGAVVTITRTNGSESKTYTLTLSMAGSSSTSLSALSLGSLLNKTDPHEVSYCVTADNSVMEVALHASAADSGARIAVTAGYSFLPVANTAGGNEFSATVPLRSGINPFFITVTAPDGTTTKETMVHVIRSGYTDTTLAGISVGGTAIPGFDPAVRDYYLTVESDASELAVAVTPQTGKRQATSITLGGARTEGSTAQVNLHPKMNDITVAVQADNLVTTGYYTIHVLKAYDDNINLRALTLEGITLSPLFSNEVKAYTAITAESAAAITLQTEDPQATLQATCNGAVLRGTGSLTGNLNFYKGENLLTITVTARDGATKAEFTACITANGQVYLSDYGWDSDSTYMSGEFLEKDHSKFNGALIPLTITGPDGAAEVTYQKGIGTHAAATINFTLDGSWSTFTCVVGMAYNTRGVGAEYGVANIKVSLDGVVTDYGEMSSTTPGQTISLDVSGVKKLSLIAENGNQPWADRVNWCDTKLLKDMPVTDSAAPSITTQPTAQTVTAPATATFTVAANTTDGGTLTYQWQSATAGGSDWTGISGATATNYTTGATTTADSGKQFRCVVTNTRDGLASSSTTSNAAALTVNTGEPAKYTLTVEHGTGGGSYAENATVTITADAPASGKVFDCWTTSDDVVFENADSATTTFFMPAKAVTVTATYTDAPVTAKDITEVAALTAINVPHGTTADLLDLPETVRVTLEDNSTAELAVTWDKTTYNGSLAGDYTLSGALTLTEQVTNTKKLTASIVVTVLEQLPETKYAVTVTGGTGSGSYAAGATVSITADTPASGQLFDQWKTEDGVAFANASATTTTFTMPAKAVAVAATYKNAPSNSGSVTPPAAKPQPPKTDDAGNTTVTVPVKPINNGTTSSATVADKTMTDAIASAVKEAEKTGTTPRVEIAVSAPATAKTVAVTLTKKSVEAVAKGKTVSLVITSPVATLSLDAKALEAIAQATVSGKVTITATQVDEKKLPAAESTLVGAAPVYDLTVTGGSVSISDFKEGSATVTLPYTLRDSGDEAFVSVWYLDEAGKLTPVKSAYANGKTTFTVNHFSRYAVGYLPFTDVAPGWSYESVVYAYNTGLFGGVGGDRFAPGDNMTRAMLLTTLHRMSGKAAESEAGETWYSAAVAWTVAEGISDGKDLEREISRQELATMLFRYAKATGTAPTGDWAVKLDYTDVDSLADWAVEGAMFAQMKGLITGKPGNRFDGGGLATRAEVAAVLQRFASATQDANT